MFIFFPFHPQQKITLVLALSITKISTMAAITNLKGGMRSARKAVQGKAEEMPQKLGASAPQPGVTIPRGKACGTGADHRGGADHIDTDHGDRS